MILRESQGRARSGSLAESRRGRRLPPPAGHRSRGSGQGGSSEAEPSVQLSRGGGNDPVGISQAESQVQTLFGLRRFLPFPHSRLALTSSPARAVVRSPVYRGGGNPQAPTFSQENKTTPGHQIPG